MVPTAAWWTPPLSIVLAGVFIVMAVTGSANDEPFAGRVTDVPVATICAELELDLPDMLGDRDLSKVVEPVAGYLW